jgi:glycosyltransferase involved in cell wall biosynthesis
MTLAERNMRVLIITNHYLNGNGGGPVATSGFVNAFATNYSDCLLIYPDSGAGIKHLVHPNLKTIPCKDFRPKWLKGLGIYFGRLHRFSRMTRIQIGKYKPDIVVFDTSIVSHGLIDLIKGLNIKVITIHHNVELDYFSDNAQPIAIRIPYLYYLKKAERNAVLKSDLSLTLSEYDNNKLKLLYSSGKKLNIRTLGVSEPYRRELKQLALPSWQNKSDTLKFIISGSLSYEQSDLSITEFIKKYFQVIRDTSVNFELIIAGSNPSRYLEELCRGYNNIRLVSNPENLMDVIAEGNIYICPVDRGSGIKLRIMDGLRLGIPVLAHEVSARGYEFFTDAGIMYTYNSTITFKLALNQILECKIQRDYIYHKNYDIFSFDSGVKRLEKILVDNF